MSSKRKLKERQALRCSHVNSQVDFNEVQEAIARGQSRVRGTMQLGLCFLFFLCFASLIAKEERPKPRKTWCLS